jgi:AraC family transcriptional regulator
MHKVIAYIDQHMDEPLDLNALAEVAHFSSYHFHRLFSAWMGETLGDYLRRRRIEIAAMRIVGQPRVTVLSIAMSVGFSSAEAFTRAFKSRFGVSPTVWRAQQIALREAISNPSQMESKPSQAPLKFLLDHEASPTQNAETIMNVKLIERQPVTIAYLRHLGAYGDPVSRFWQGTYYPWAVANNLLDKPRYGISHDDPSITAAEQCRYDAAVEVAPDFVPNGGALKTTLPGGCYAVLRFKGTSDRVCESWAALLRDWLPTSGLQLDARPCFEYYPFDGTYDSKTGAFECDISVPVVPL